VTKSCAARSAVLEPLRRLRPKGSSHALPNITNRGPSDPVATSSTIQTRLTSTPVQILDPLNPPEEPPSGPSPTILLQSMPEPWRLSGEEAMKLSPAVECTLASGWTSQSLKADLSRRPDGGRYPAAVLARRLAKLPTPPSPSLRRKTPWCGECEDEQFRTITVTPPDGTEAAAFCPRCSPQKRPLSVDQKTANIEER
jgi:hypothetical protein